MVLYAQGSASGVIDSLSGVAITAKDVISKLAGKETESDKIKRISDYFSQNPADRALLGKKGNDFELANKIGVSVNDLNAYNFYTINQQMAEMTEKKGNNLDENVKNVAGGIAETMGGLVAAKGVGAAFGAASATSTVIDNIKNKSGLSKTLTDLFKITPQNAVYGLGTAGSETLSLAQSRGYNPLNIVTAAAKGYAETTAENIGGVEELKWFDKLNAGKNVGKAVANHFIDSLSEVGEEELTLVMQNIIDKTFVNNDRKWSGVGGVFDGGEMLNTAITSFAIGEIVGGVKLATDIKNASKSGKATEQNEADAKKTLDYINDSLPQKYKQDISDDSAEAAAQKIIGAEIEYLKEIDDKTINNSVVNKAVDDIISSAVKTTAFSSSVTKQNMLDRMSERGYTPSAVMGNVPTDNLSPEVKTSLEQLTDKLDTEFASAWYSDNGATAGREAAGVYLKANNIANAVKSINLASDVAKGKLSGRSATKALTQAAALINSSDADASAVIDAATSLIVSANENTKDISLDYASDLIDAVNNAMYEQGYVIEPETSAALTDMLFGGNVSQKNLGYVLGDVGATKTLEKLLGMNIDEKTKVDTVKRKVRDMVNSYRAGQGKLFDFVASQKNKRRDYYDRMLSELGADEEAAAGFKNALLNGKLTERQAVAIATDVDVFNLYVNATAGRLGSNPTIDDMINAAGYVGGFDLAGDISPYYDKGYSRTVESDTLVPDEETGVYDAGSGTVILNKKAEPIKKLSYKLAQELLNNVANEHKSSDNVRYSTDGNLSVKEQINNNLNFLNSMDAVATVNEDYIFENKQKAREWAISRFEKYNYKIFRNGFGEVVADKNRIGKSMRYYTTIEEIIAFDAVPQVIMKGINIGKHPKHKGRDYDTITFAAPIIINGNRLNMAVVVRQEGNNYYKVHRIVMPDGSKVDINKKRDDAGRAGGINNDSGLSPTDNVSINSISNSDENVNTLVNSVINYMSANGYDLNTEINRVIKKFNPYILEHRARLNSSLLSEQSLQREIAADFLTSVFSDEAAIQKLADTDLSLAVDLAERVKAFANATSDGMMKDFANGVFDKMHIHFRTKLNQMKLNNVLSERRNNGLSSDAIIEADNEFFKTIELDNFNFDDMKKEALDTGNAAYRKWVDSGEAFARLGKDLGVNDLYATFNSIRQAKAKAEVMITKRCVDINGKEVGPALAEIFKTVYENGTAEAFDLYLQYLNNSARYKTGQEIIKGMDTETSLERAAALERKHPEFLKLREKVYKYRDVLLAWRVATGNMTQQEADYLREKNPYYVPAWVITEKNGDAPFYADSVVTTKGLKRAVNNAMAHPLMPVFKAMAIQTERMVYETGLNHLFVKIENELEKRDMLYVDENFWTVSDPKIFKYIQSIAPVENKNVHAPRSEHGVYLTPNATNNLTEKIKELLVYDENRSAINAIIRDFAKGVTLNEHYEAQHIDELLSNLKKLGVEYKDKYFSNMKKIAKMSSVCDIPASKLERTGKRPRDIFTEFFDSMGNVIKTKTLGDVAVSPSSAKSEIRHGITAEKIASIEAIPSVLQNGKIIFKERKKDTDVERIVVCAPITIGNEPYYMGVMVQKDAQSQRVYLHNVVIEKEMPSLQVDRLTNGTLKENEHLYITNIIQKALSVKKNSYNGALDIDVNSIISLCNNAIVDAKPNVRKSLKLIPKIDLRDLILKVKKILVFKLMNKAATALFITKMEKREL